MSDSWLQSERSVSANLTLDDLKVVLVEVVRSAVCEEVERLSVDLKQDHQSLVTRLVNIRTVLSRVEQSLEGRISAGSDTGTRETRESNLLPGRIPAQGSLPKLTPASEAPQWQAVKPQWDEYPISYQSGDDAERFSYPQVLSMDMSSDSPQTSADAAPVEQSKATEFDAASQDTGDRSGSLLLTPKEATTNGIHLQPNLESKRPAEPQVQVHVEPPKGHPLALGLKPFLHRSFSFESNKGGTDSSSLQNPMAVSHKPSGHSMGSNTSQERVGHTVSGMLAHGMQQDQPTINHTPSMMSTDPRTKNQQTNAMLANALSQGHHQMTISKAPMAMMADMSERPTYSNPVTGFEERASLNSFTRDKGKKIASVDDLDHMVADHLFELSGIGTPSGNERFSFGQRPSFGGVRLSHPITDRSRTSPNYSMKRKVVPDEPRNSRGDVQKESSGSAGSGMANKMFTLVNTLNVLPMHHNSSGNDCTQAPTHITERSEPPSYVDDSEDPMDEEDTEGSPDHHPELLPVDSVSARSRALRNQSIARMSQHWGGMDELRVEHENILVAASELVGNPNGDDEPQMAISLQLLIPSLLLCLFGVTAFNHGIISFIYQLLLFLALCGTGGLSIYTAVTTPGQLYDDLVVIVLSSSACLGLLFLQFQGIQELLGPRRAPLERYAATWGFLKSWNLASRRRLTSLGIVYGVAFACKSAVFFIQTNFLEKGVEREMQSLFSFAFATACLFVLMFCHLHVCSCLELAIDHFCVRLFEEADLSKGISEWNVLQALLRRAAHTVEACFLAISTGVLGVLLLTGLELFNIRDAETGESVLTSTLVLTLWAGWVMPLAVLVFYGLFRAAAVTEKCNRVPALVNSWSLAEDTIDLTKQYAVQYIIQSAAGFYIKGVRLSATWALKMAYVFGALVFTTVSQAFLAPMRG